MKKYAPWLIGGAVLTAVLVLLSVLSKPEITQDPTAAPHEELVAPTLVPAGSASTESDTSAE